MTNGFQTEEIRSFFDELTERERKRLATSQEEDAVQARKKGIADRRQGEVTVNVDVKPAYPSSLPTDTLFDHSAVSKPRMYPMKGETYGSREHMEEVTKRRQQGLEDEAEAILQPIDEKMDIEADPSLAEYGLTSESGGEVSEEIADIWQPPTGVEYVDSSSSSLPSQKGKRVRTPGGVRDKIVRPKVESILASEVWSSGGDWMGAIVDQYADNNPLISRERIAQTVQGVFLENRKAWDRAGGDKGTYQDWVQRSIAGNKRMRSGGKSRGKRKQKLPEEDVGFADSVFRDVFATGKAHRTLKSLQGVQRRITTQAGVGQVEDDTELISRTGSPDWSEKDDAAVAARGGGTRKYKLAADSMMRKIKRNGGLGWDDTNKRLAQEIIVEMQRIAKQKNKKGRRMSEILADEERRNAFVEYYVLDKLSLGSPVNQGSSSGRRKSFKSNRK